MKKILFIALFGLLAFSYQANAQWVNLDDKTSFNFIAPDNATSTVNEVLFPIAESESYDFDTNDTVTITVNQMIHVFAVDTIEGAMYVNATKASQVTTGGMILFKLPADGSERKVYFNTGFYTDSVTVAASTTAVPIAVHDGTSYRIIE